MPTSCSAPGCTQWFTKSSDIHFYRFPKDGVWNLRCQKVLKHVQIENPNELWEPADRDRLCSLRFVSGKNKYLALCVFFFRFLIRRRLSFSKTFLVYCIDYVFLFICVVCFLFIYLQSPLASPYNKKNVKTNMAYIRIFIVLSIIIIDNNMLCL